MGFSRQEYWSGLPCPSSGSLPNPGIEPGSPALWADAIKRELPVIMEEMSVDAAREAGAIGLFGDRYGERVKVYTIGDVSKEICGGPHAGNTAELKSFKIQKEESSSRGVRRIKAVIGA